MTRIIPSLLRLFDHTCVMLKIRSIVSGILVIIDTDYQGVSCVMLESVEVVLLSHLIHGNISRLVVFQFYQKCRLILMTWRREICHIGVSLAGIKFKDGSVILLRSVVRQLDS